MEDKKNVKVNKNLKRLSFLLLIIFATLYISGKTGYYETRIENKTILTKDAIKEFEKDVAEGKEVDIKDYVDTKVTNYNNKFSNMGLTLSNSIDYILNDGVKWILKIIKTLFS